MMAHPSYRLHISALTALFISAPAGLYAAGNPKILVLPYQHLKKGMPNDLGDKTTGYVAKELSTAGLSIVRADDVGGAAPSKSQSSKPSNAPTGDPAAGEKAEELLTQAKESMQEDEFEQAARYLKRAVDLLEENGDAVPDLRLLAEAYLQLGVAYFRDGLEDEGDDMLNRAAHYNPTRDIAKDGYPPIFVKVFERAKFNVLRRPRAMVEVRGTANAQVLLDGRNMGKAPINLKDALPGKHWVRLEQPGAPVQVKKISVRAKRTIKVEFSGASDGADDNAPVGVLGAIAKNEINASHIKQLKRAGARAGADYVMFGGIFATDTAYQVRTAFVSVKTGEVGRLVNVAFDLDLLSAEIEVFKLAEDAKKQSDGLANIISEKRFKIAPKYRSRARRRVARAGGRETRVATVQAAPPPTKPPKSLYATNAAPVAKVSKARKPASKRPSLVIKDEIGGSSKKRTAVTQVTTDNPGGEKESSTWWIWLIVGVAAAGAAAGGTYAAVNNAGNSSNGSLQISW